MSRASIVCALVSGTGPVVAAHGRVGDEQVELRAGHGAVALDDEQVRRRRAAAGASPRDGRDTRRPRRPAPRRRALTPAPPRRRGAGRRRR